MSTLKELAATYNEVAATLGEKPVIKFRNRASAERRVAEMLARLKLISGPFSRTPARVPLAELSPPREGTQRAQCIALMLRPEGADYGEIVAVVLAHSKKGNVSQRVRDIVGLTHKVHGYGVRCAEDGSRIFAFV
ncbi:MAG: hypothetical protein V7675_08150 [Hyphomonas sp.]|uniref:hypothetical protein n=1 Tax=Hyphomonas sp. TaxID=87 RepID=UPI003002D778